MEKIYEVYGIGDGYTDSIYTASIEAAERYINLWLDGELLDDNGNLSTIFDRSYKLIILEIDLDKVEINRSRKSTTSRVIKSVIVPHYYLQD